MEKSKLTRIFVTDLKGVSNRYSTIEVNLEKEQILFIGTLRTIYKFMIKENKPQIQKFLDIHDKNNIIFLSCLTYIKLGDSQILLCSLEIENEQKFQIKAYDFEGDEILIQNQEQLNFQCLQMKTISIGNDINYVICISPNQLYIINFYYESNQDNKKEEIILKYSINQMYVNSFILDLDYIINENYFYFVFSFLERSIQIYKLNINNFKNDHHKMLINLLAEIEKNIFTKQIELESVISYCRFLVKNGQLDLIVANTSGCLYKYNQIDQKELQDQQLLTKFNIKESITGLAIQEYENDYEILISYFGGIIELYKYNEMKNDWKLAVQTKSNFNHFNLYFFYNYDNFIFTLVADRFIECYELQNYFIN